MASRRTRAAITIGVSSFVVGALAVLIHLERVQRPTSEAPASAVAHDEVGFRLEDRRIVDHSLGLTFEAPEPWTTWDPPTDGAPLDVSLGVFLRHPQGVYLNANAGLRTPGAGVEPTLQGILEDKLGQYGEAIDDIEWGRDLLANQFNARTVAFTIHRQEVGVRCRIWGFATGSYWLSLSCSAPVSVFPTGEELCRGVFNSFRLQPPSR